MKVEYVVNQFLDTDNGWADDEYFDNLDDARTHALWRSNTELYGIYEVSTLDENGDGKRMGIAIDATWYTPDEKDDTP